MFWFMKLFPGRHGKWHFQTLKINISGEGWSMPLSSQCVLYEKCTLHPSSEQTTYQKLFILLGGDSWGTIGITCLMPLNTTMILGCSIYSLTYWSLDHATSHYLNKYFKSTIFYCIFQPIIHRCPISSYSVIIWVSVVLKRTVIGDWRFDNLSGSHLHLTLKMTSAQVVEMSVTNNSSFRNYTHPNDHTIWTTDTAGFKPFTMSNKSFLLHLNCWPGLFERWIMLSTG